MADLQEPSAAAKKRGNEREGFCFGSSKTKAWQNFFWLLRALITFSEICMCKVRVSKIQEVKKKTIYDAAKRMKKSDFRT